MTRTCPDCGGALMGSAMRQRCPPCAAAARQARDRARYTNRPRTCRRCALPLTPSQFGLCAPCRRRYRAELRLLRAIGRAPIRDFTPAQIEARYQRAVAARRRWRPSAQSA
jgi:hypothetical protein